MVSSDQQQDHGNTQNSTTLRPVTQIDHWPRANTGHIQQQGRSPQSRFDDLDQLPFHEGASDSIKDPGQAGSSSAENQLSTKIPSVPTSHLADREPIPHYEQSVWSKYEKRYQIDLNDMVAVAQTKGRSPALFVVRQSSNKVSSNKLHLLQHLCREPAFVRIHEVFISSTICQFVCEPMDCTLEHLLGAPVYPEEKHIAAIAGQILQGLVFLHHGKYFHGNLKLSTILANRMGEIKIEGDVCRADPKTSQTFCLRDVQNFGEIILLLVTKSSGEERRPDENRYSSDVLDFVSQANVSTAKELTKHKLINSGWSRHDLVWLFTFTLMTARRRHILPWQEPKGN